MQTLTFNWACAGALVCITGPDGKVWKYVGDGAGGTTGHPSIVNDGTRPILQITYDASNRPSVIENANDLNTAAAQPWSAGHQLEVAYDAGSPARVLSVTEKQVADRKLTPILRDLTWSFAYAIGNVACPSGRTSHTSAVAAHQSSTRVYAGCTDVTLPEPKPGTATANKVSVYYDPLAHPIETVDATGGANHYVLSQWNDRNTLDWTEDQLGNPTDYTYDGYTYTLTSVEAPDPDGTSQPAPRPKTQYFSTNKRRGNGAPREQLAGAGDYKNPDLTGRPRVDQDRPRRSRSTAWRSDRPRT